MWVTVEETKELTGHDVTRELIAQAQAIIESYVGRIENDVNNVNDKMLLARATAFQAVYMAENEDLVYKTQAVSQLMQFGNMVAYADQVAPFVAPLAVIACKKLTWKRIRSVKTGGLFDEPVSPYDWSTD